MTKVPNIVKSIPKLNLGSLLHMMVNDEKIDKAPAKKLQN